MNTKTKTCAKCGVEKTVDNFYKRKSTSHLYGSNCRECISAIGKDYWKNNSVKLMAARTTTHRDYRETARKYREANRDANIKVAAQWRIDNPERFSEMREAWRKSNMGLARMYRSSRKSQQKIATPKWANREKIREFYVLADALGMHTGEWYHVDHIVPVRSKFVCGLHNEFNLQVLPAKHNLTKGNVFWPDMP